MLTKGRAALRLCVSQALKKLVGGDRYERSEITSSASPALAFCTPVSPMGTGRLAANTPESVELFRNLMPELLSMLEARYPKRHFICLRPNDEPNASPL